MKPRDPVQTRATLCAVVAVLAWSTVATAFKLALRDLDHYQLLFLANVFSLLALGLVLCVKRQNPLRLTRGQYLRAALLGLLNPFLYYLVLFKAYALLPAQIAQPLNYTWAFTLTVLSVPVLGHRFTRRDVVAGAICYLGVVVIATGGQPVKLPAASVLGVALALGSTVIWALYWLGNTRLVRKYPDADPVLNLFWGFVFSLPWVALTTVLFSTLRLSGPGVLPAVYVGFVEMGFTFVLWSTAMSLTSSTAKIANLIFLSPFLSLVWIHFVLGESIAAGTVIGLLFLSGGLIWQQWD